eukprot:Trichotokara_eunicae@DN9647_c0_g1_i1.p1
MLHQGWGRETSLVSHEQRIYETFIDTTKRKAIEYHRNVIAALFESHLLTQVEKKTKEQELENKQQDEMFKPYLVASQCHKLIRSKCNTKEWDVVLDELNQMKQQRD